VFNQSTFYFHLNVYCGLPC